MVIFFSGKTETKFLRKIRLLTENAYELVVGLNSRVFN